VQVGDAVAAGPAAGAQHQPPANPTPTDAPNAAHGYSAKYRRTSNVSFTVSTVELTVLLTVSTVSCTASLTLSTVSVTAAVVLCTLSVTVCSNRSILSVNEDRVSSIWWRITSGSSSIARSP
jgi:hypothetical protein